MPELEELKGLLAKLPNEYGELSQKVADAEGKFKEAELELNRIKAVQYLKIKAEDSTKKAAEINAQVTVDTNTVSLLTLQQETTYKSLKCQLEALDKKIQLVRNRCELFICESYSTNSMQSAGNIRKGGF